MTKTKAQKFDFEKSRKNKEKKEVRFLVQSCPRSCSRKLKSVTRIQKCSGSFIWKRKIYFYLCAEPKLTSQHNVKKWLAISKFWLEVSWEKQRNSSSKENYDEWNLSSASSCKRRKLVMQNSQLDYLWRLDSMVRILCDRIILIQ